MNNATRTVELPERVAATALWLAEAIEATRYGEIQIVYRVHAGRDTIEERTITSKRKHEEARQYD